MAVVLADAPLAPANDGRRTGQVAQLERAPAACIKTPVRPLAPDIFGRSAAPIGARAAHPQWALASSLDLTRAHGSLDELLGQASLQTGTNTLDTVNRWVNWHVRYGDDSNGDVWSSAAETLVRGFGDCEDIAIAKMAILAQLGIPQNDMFLVLVRRRQAPIDHAVLAVRSAGTVYVLDNLTDVMHRESETGDYQPTLGFSGSFAWIYGLRLPGATESMPGAESQQVPAAGTAPDTARP